MKRRVLKERTSYRKNIVGGIEFLLQSVRILLNVGGRVCAAKCKPGQTRTQKNGGKEEESYWKLADTDFGVAIEKRDQILLGLDILFSFSVQRGQVTVQVRLVARNIGFQDGLRQK